MWNLRARLYVGVAVVLMSIAPGAGYAGTLSPDLEQQLESSSPSARSSNQPGTAASREPRVRVIVQARHSTSRQLVKRWVQSRGGQIFRDFRTLEGFSADIPAAWARYLGANLHVRYVTPDREVSGSLDLTTAAVGAPAVWTASGTSGAGLDGSGVGVAVLDTGVALHPDLTSGGNRVTGWVDFIRGKKAPYDDHGHGTHVAGIIAGNGSRAAAAGRDVRGVAPGARVIGVKVLDHRAKGYVSSVIAALEWCIEHRNRYNIRVVNLSMGTPAWESYQLDPLCQAVEAANRAGLVVVVSAGNGGRVDPTDPNSGVRYGTITSPGIDPLAITVGATRTNATADPADDLVATYSSRGPTQVDRLLKPDVVAPGNRVVSLLADGRARGLFRRSIVPVGAAQYLELSGTSMAAPVVAGTAALMLQADPSQDPDTVKLRLMASARKSWNPSLTDRDLFSWGAGLVDVPAAIASSLRASDWAASPTVVRGEAEGSLTFSSTVIQDAPRTGLVLWENTVVWGDLMLWDEGPQLKLRLTIWGDLMLWDESPTRRLSPILWRDGAALPD